MAIATTASLNEANRSIPRVVRLCRSLIGTRYTWGPLQRFHETAPTLGDDAPAFRSPVAGEGCGTIRQVIAETYDFAIDPAVQRCEVLDGQGCIRLRRIAICLI